jgi:molybdenum cofactor biosynthesis protein B
MAHREHERRAPRSVGCAVITVTDSRTTASDRSGDAIRAALIAAGHVVALSEIVADDRTAIRDALAGATGRGDIAAVILTGGTGIAARDVTVESLADRWSKELPGFGEIFRALSVAEIGAAAFLSRATAGVIDGRFVVVLPGSTAACELAMERLVVPQLGHAVGLLGASS